MEVEDLLKAFESWSKQKAIGRPYRPTRTPGRSPSQIATIVLAYHFSGYKGFEYYYKECILQPYLHGLPPAPCYQRFVPSIPSGLPLLLLLLMLKTAQSSPTGYYFIDSKKIQGCPIGREKEQQVLKDFAAKGKSSTGWFYGLKVHLGINHLGQIVAFRLTAGSTADNNQAVLRELLAGLKGKCCGDKGYLSTWFERLYPQGLHLVVRPKKKMKSLPVYPSDVRFMKQRAVIESVNDILATVGKVEHSRHRNALQGMANILAALIAYPYLPAKPHVFIPNAINYLHAA